MSEPTNTTPATVAEVMAQLAEADKARAEPQLTSRQRRARMRQPVKRCGVPPLGALRRQPAIQRMGAKRAQGDGEETNKRRSRDKPVHRKPSHGIRNGQPFRGRA